MRILTAALICFVIASASYSATVEQIMFGDSGLPNYSLILILLSTYLMLEGIYSIERERQQVTDSLRKDARRHLRSYEQEPVTETDDTEAEALKVALRNAEDKIRELDKLSASSAASTDVDAEIVNFLGVLQEQGRLVDFLMDDIATYDDAQIGSAARVVHQGCREILEQYFEIAPVFQGDEGAPTELTANFSPEEFRIIGSAIGEPPYSGTVVHRGWRTSKVGIPRVITDVESRAQHDIIAPAQVEIG